MNSFEKYKDRIDEFCGENVGLRRRLLRDLCFIPAPSGSEKKRAFYCLEFCKSTGADTAYIDENNSVIFELNCEGKTACTLITAHLDTVFQDFAPMPYFEDAENDTIKCPGIGDDTANVTSVLLIMKFFLETGIKPEEGLIFMCDARSVSGCEGIGSFVSANSGRIGRVVVFDSINWKSICDGPVAKREMTVGITTQGGHAQHAFGRPNAIEIAARIIEKIYTIKKEKSEREISTYNVGYIHGGSHRITVAEHCEFEVECRSSNPEKYAELRSRITECILSENAPEHRVEILSDSGIEGWNNESSDEIKRMIGICADVITYINGKPPIYSNAPTSANVPMELGIPAICLGSFNGDNVHTVDEYVKLSSLEDGLRASIGFIVGMTVE